tara:strand:+ start:1791 stop:2609 length:819 start_codon:yes stop_codon:yes gene_type:complete
MGFHNSGPGFFGLFSRGGSRSDTFKKGRKVDDKVRGTLLKWVSGDMAWVNIEGHKLLAQLNSKPLVGATLTFVIKQLNPDIVLKELFAPTGGNSGALSLARNFETARTLFQTRFHQQKPTVGFGQSADKRHFLDALSSNDQLFAAYVDTLNCIKTINSTIDQHKNGILFYTPWIVAGARNHIGLMKLDPVGISEVRYELELPILGLIRADFLYKPSAVSYRLRLEHPSYANQIKRVLGTCHIEGFDNFHCLGVGPLPKHQHGGILAEILFKQ